jgi:phosphate transport system substrate-binding protein
MSRLMRTALVLGVLLGLLPGTALASTFRITLNDGTEIVGTIRDFDEGIYTIATARAERRASVSDLKAIEPLEVANATTRLDANSLPAVPEFTITTTGARTVVGRILSFDEGNYDVMTRAGIVSVPVATIRSMQLAWVERQPIAIRPGMPLIPGTVRVAGADAATVLYMPAILDAYSGAGAGRDPLWTRGPQSYMRTFSVTGASGKFVAQLRTSDAKSAIKALADRQTDLAVIGRRMQPAEAEFLATKGLGGMLSPQQEIELAPSGIAVVVHPSNPVKALKREEIAGIFSGQIRNWSEVGGAARRIQVFVPEDGSGLLDLFQAEVLGSQKMIGTAKHVANDAEMSDTVSIDSAAIGFVDYASIGNATALAVEDSCGRPVVPTEFNIQTREYALGTQLYLYMPAKSSPQIRALAAFATSDPGQQALKHAGLPNTLPMLRPAEEPPLPAPQTARWPTGGGTVSKEIDQFVTNANRVSVSIRFGEGIKLAADADEEINRLVSYIKGLERTPRLVLLGFSDIEGDLPNAVRLSERRARLIERRLKTLGVAVEQAFGLGPLRPIACDGGARVRNRRVEAWLM